MYWWRWCVDNGDSAFDIDALMEMVRWRWRCIEEIIDNFNHKEDEKGKSEELEPFEGGLVGWFDFCLKIHFVFICNYVSIWFFNYILMLFNVYLEGGELWSVISNKKFDLMGVKVINGVFPTHIK